MHTFFVTSSDFGIGLTSVSLSLLQALKDKGLKIGFYKPFTQQKEKDLRPEYSTELIKKILGITSPTPLFRNHIEQRLSHDELDILLEEANQLFQQASIDKDVVIIEGIEVSKHTSYAHRLNSSLAQSLGADIILVTAPEENQSLIDLINSIKIQAYNFGGPRNNKLIGVIIDQIKEITDLDNYKKQLINTAPDLFKDHFKLLGCNLWQKELNSPFLRDIARQFKAKVIKEGNLNTSRIQQILLCPDVTSKSLPYFSAGTLVITSGNNSEIILAACLAVINGIPLAGLLFVNDSLPDANILKLCNTNSAAGLSILSVTNTIYETINQLSLLNTRLSLDDYDGAKQVTNCMTKQLDTEWIFHCYKTKQEAHVSATIFRYQLVKRAQEANKRIVLPEGNEPRTIQAAIICHQRQIARCVLLAKPLEVQTIANSLGLQLPQSLEIIDPDTIIQNYINPLVKLRQNKGMTPLLAEQSLRDTVVLGTMMLAVDDVDGLVSGAIHTTANTVRPALQLIKTAPEYNLVSSIFFMLLPDQVLVYGDCAINPNPTAEQLADIAIQSAQSALAFGITPKVAMISYSTGTSGGGEDVEKVKQATELAKQKCPDLLIDGPLQYDAAAIESVGKQKAPNSAVAGKANVFIFPDLNTGNTTYKAVQRSAKIISLGPMLQGLRKPVNDLSRGALVEDIVFTIALTAIQAIKH